MPECRRHAVFQFNIIYSARKGQDDFVKMYSRGEFCAAVAPFLWKLPSFRFFEKKLGKKLSHGTADCCGLHKALPAAKFSALYKVPGLRPGTMQTVSRPDFCGLQLPNTAPRAREKERDFSYSHYCSLGCSVQAGAKQAPSQQTMRGPARESQPSQRDPIFRDAKVLLFWCDQQQKEYWLDIPLCRHIGWVIYPNLRRSLARDPLHHAQSWCYWGCYK